MFKYKFESVRVRVTSQEYYLHAFIRIDRMVETVCATCMYCTCLCMYACMYVGMDTEWNIRIIMMYAKVRFLPKI